MGFHDKETESNLRLAPTYRFRRQIWFGFGVIPLYLM